MPSNLSDRRASPLRARMIEDMIVRGFTEKTRQDYVRHVQAFAAFLGRSPDTARAEDLRRFQLHRRQSGMQPPSINSAVSALRFFFTVTLDRPDLARRLTVVPQPRRLPAVLSAEEVLLLRGKRRGRSTRRRLPPQEMLWGERRGSGLCRCRNRRGCPRPQPNDLSRSLTALD